MSSDNYCTCQCHKQSSNSELHCRVCVNPKQVSVPELISEVTFKLQPLSIVKKELVALKNALLPDPNDERDISLDWFRDKYAKSLDVMLRNLFELDFYSSMTPINFNDSTREKNLSVGDRLPVPDISKMKMQATAINDFRSLQLIDVIERMQGYIDSLEKQNIVIKKDEG